MDFAAFSYSAKSSKIVCYLYSWSKCFSHSLLLWYKVQLICWVIVHCLLWTTRFGYQGLLWRTLKAIGDACMKKVLFQIGYAWPDICLWGTNRAWHAWRLCLTGWDLLLVNPYVLYSFFIKWDHHWPWNNQVPRILIATNCIIAKTEPFVSQEMLWES